MEERTDGVGWCPPFVGRRVYILGCVGSFFFGAWGLPVVFVFLVVFLVVFAVFVVVLVLPPRMGYA